jgi:transcriptional antiterminator RfaH
MKRWYAVYTQPRHEALAGENLVRQGFNIVYPRYMKRRAHARRVEMVPAPLFPRYLFVNFDAGAGGWRAIRSSRGVIDLVSSGNDPTPVPDAIIDEIRRRQDEEGFVVLARQLNLKRGARIRIDEGPFSSHDAIFEMQRDDERVVALLSLLGRQVVVQLPATAVAPAS